MTDFYNFFKSVNLIISGSLFVFYILNVYSRFVFVCMLKFGLEWARISFKSVL